MEAGKPRVAIIGGMRTPFVKSNTVFKDISALDLGVHAVKGLLAKYPIDQQKISELVFGTVVHNPKIANLGREVVLASGLPKTIPAYTVSNNCISGVQAVTNVYDSITNGRGELGIGGGTESLSNIPVLFQKQFARILMNFSSAKTFSQKLQALMELRLNYLKPDYMGIEEPSTGLTMGQHCEIMAKDWKIPREAQDEIALQSHMKAYQATQDGRLTQEIYPLNGVAQDTIIRKDTSLEKLAKLKPVFDPTPTGTITAGNSSPLTDGASAVLLASEEFAKQNNLEPLAYIKAFEYTGIDPKDGLLMGPGIAVPQLLRKTGLRLEDMDLIDMHEAFAAQILCNLKAFEQGWKEPAIGKVDPQKLNVMGGSIAIGHPFAATGARIITSVANEMKRRNARYALISACAAGGTAAAMILER